MGEIEGRIDQNTGVKCQKGIAKVKKVIGKPMREDASKKSGRRIIHCNWDSRKKSEFKRILELRNLKK